MFNRAGNLLHWPRGIKEVHLVILFSNFIWYTACPSFDFVEPKLLLVVPGFANVYFLVGWEAARAALIKPCHEHDEATVDNFTKLVVAVLSRLHDFMFEKVLLVSMHRLLGSIIPAGVDPLLSLAVLPHPIDLCDNRLGKIIRVANVNPVA